MSHCALALEVLISWFSLIFRYKKLQNAKGLFITTMFTFRKQAERSLRDISEVTGRGDKSVTASNNREMTE